ncbi:response regulator [Paenibacillus sp. YIM B09110]|uniref:response regulator n=1 Tax=Paenibacillus sp. YIM B09110 TaxID=3126102 RepID=UPI00301BCBBA
MTYHLLLVDDEVHAIEGVKTDLDLSKLDIARLYTAYNIRQAKEIMDKEVIHILLCDIEMPQGSGLELLAWVREHHPLTETIILTSHADFKYAKEALQLGSLDYLLKPVFADDLEPAIRKAQDVIVKNSEMSRNSQSWLKHHSLIIEHFWLNLINHSTPSHRDAVREQIELHHIPITEHMMFLPVLVRVQKWHKELRRRDEKILEYALKNSAEETIIGSERNGNCLQLERDMLLIILAVEGQAGWDLESVQDACRHYIAACNQYFYCDLSCYLGQIVEAHEMLGIVTDLRSQDRNNVSVVNKVFTDQDAKPNVQLIEMPDWSVLSSLLKTGTKESVIQEIKAFLTEPVRNRALDANFLHQFNQNFVQLLYTFLYAKEIQAHQLFGEEESRRLSEKAGRSVTDMLEWADYAINKALNQAQAVEESDTIVQTIKRYISLNMDKEISREEMAELVFLSADHLTRLFKKETGHSISDYMMLEKTKLAKELLTQTAISISAIATAVGYSNFSHFTKIFKKYAGVGPKEYRKQFGGN